MIFFHRSFLLILIFSIVNSCSYFYPELEEIEDIDYEINQLMAEEKIPSISACIIKENEIVWKRNYGYTDYENKKEANNSTIYELASVSKLVIVTAVMQLYENGLIDLNEDVNNYLPFTVRNPNYPEEKISTYILLTHTSGLAWPFDDYEVPGFYDYYPLDSAPPLSSWLPEYILPDGNNYVNNIWKKTIPGKHELYSNVGTAILAYLVEVVSGIDFNIYCKENIFKPLEMFNTSYAYGDLDMNKVTKIYWGNYEPIQHYRQLSYPTHSLKSSVEDFSHFIIAYINGGVYKSSRILRENTINEILKIRNYASGLCLIWNNDVGNWYGHTGGEPGSATNVEFQPQDKIGIISFSNKRNNLIYPGNKIHSYLRREVNKYR